ncbi:hypothetical protein Pmani_032344 [Petrolisthes manimaculis]|uniref:Uncharacterized protein n=1 Tax=Petrolisthes manimaculis TaxID=1843537 RepID=A0AAE1TRI7_9EUCA|nr:hypothetical protein Pmani_032344 [Petrolisthes manimaculis]
MPPSSSSYPPWRASFPPFSHRTSSGHPTEGPAGATMDHFDTSPPSLPQLPQDSATPGLSYPRTQLPQSPATLGPSYPRSQAIQAPATLGPSYPRSQLP